MRGHITVTAAVAINTLLLCWTRQTQTAGTGCALARQEAYSISAPQVPAVASSTCVSMGRVHIHPHLYAAL